MKNYIQKELKRYVIATLDNPTKFLIFANNKIRFTTDIKECTKTSKKDLAESIKDEFYSYTKRYDIELIVVPLVIKYELINENNYDFVELKKGESSYGVLS